MTAPQATEQPVAPPPTEPERLHRPVRAVVALAEVLAAAAAIWGAFWAWPRGFSTITTVLSDGTVLESQRVYGDWLTVAIGFGTVAALLVLDALRQALLAVRAKPRRARQAADPAATVSTTSDEKTGADAAQGAQAVSDARVSGED